MVPCRAYRLVGVWAELAKSDGRWPVKPGSPVLEWSSVARLRTILLIRVLEDDASSIDSSSIDPAAAAVLNAVPLGTVRELTSIMARFNIAPDGSPMTPNVMYGPGVIAQFPFLGPNDSVQQVLVSLVEDDIAWPVLIRLCKANAWKMMDPESGRTFG